MASCCRGSGSGTGTVTAFGLLPPSLSLSLHHHLLLLLLLLAAAVHASSDLSTDAQALLAFKLAVAPDPQQLLTTWTSQSASNPCSWQGVTCSTASQQRVVGLNLTGAQLLAQLPPSALSSLDALQYLSLAANSFYGNLSALEDLAHTAPLEVLDLSSNTFDGPIPLAFFSSRLTLNLANNQLSGGIPALPSPMHLDLSNNSLSGPLPPELFPSVDGPSLLITLNLALNGFSGPIPSQLVNNCTTLQVLDLSANGLMGSIPPAPGFGKCVQLRYLNLSGNHFSGLAPSDLLQPSGLEVVDVSNNNLTGSLAPIRCPQNLSVLNMAWNHLSGLAWLNFTACPSLEILDLSGNGLSGQFLVGSGSLPLPPSAPNLRIFHMADNNLSGSLPPQFPALFPALQDLDLSFNLLVGSVPSFPPGSPLVSLNLANNNFSGDLPVDLIYSLCAGSLQYLVLAFNAFTGQLPDSFLSECPQLKVLDLSSNSINGTVPADLCPEDVIPALQVFSIPNNAIYGPIPAGLAKCRNLMTLDLSFNFMNGPIPPELGSLEYLEYLYLWSNQLNGSIPSSLGNCSRLKGLVLNYNLLTGAIPPELSKCSELLWLSLNTNFLSGEIPREIGVMQKLALLQLGNNSFTGSIPTELGNCTGLVWLDVNRNQLTGSIPSPIGRRKFKSEINPDLEKFRFAFVKNIGPNCQGIGGLMEFSGIRLEELLSPRLISCNFTLLFSGPNNFYNWRNDSSIEYLDMSFNNLEGPIPDDFGNMKDLHVLNLAHNMLNGTLPESLGNSSSLESLTLSYNQFSGGIPASFAMLSFLSSFDVSNNQLSGQIPQGGQLDTFPAWVYANNTGLCGLTVLGLPPCSGNANGSGSGYGGDSAGGRGRHKRREALAPWATSLLLAFLISSGLVVVILVWWVWTGRRLPWWKQLRHRGSLETGHDRIPSWNAADWKSGYGREPLSINVATFERPLRRLTFANLLEATNGFSEESIIGAGGFGEVYKAELPDGTVAVKKLIHSSFQGDREFTAEMETLGKIKHHNLVPLLGYCKVGEERLLVYEFMACGSLEHILHDREQPVEVDKLLHLQQMQQQLQAHQQMQQQQQQQLPAPAPAAPAAKKVGNSGLLTPPLRIEFDWELRRQVAMGAARGLAFLHHNCIPHIIHRDMKSSNVLLDRHLVARVSDFGMARLISASDTHLSVSTLAGTPGYVPPEYYQSFRCTTKGDVYSFGVVLLELLTGKRPTNKEEFGDSNLVGWVKLLLAQKRSTEVLDPDLRGNGMEQDMLQHLRIACMCVEDVPSHRPTMLQVVAMFKELHLDNVS